MNLLQNIAQKGTSNQVKPYRWYHGALFLAGITLIERGLEGLVKKSNPDPSLVRDDQQYYKTQKQPWFAPPAKAFPIAWLINDVATIWGNLRVLNMPSQTPGRHAFLRLQAGSWLTYSLFTAGHFGLRSPLNALLLTLTHAGLNVASEVVAIRQLKDRKVALSLAPVLSWLTIALPTAATTALWNQDRFYDTRPMVRPDHRWLKKLAA